MTQIHCSSRAQWRRWLTQNHNREINGIWLVYYKQGTGKASLNYEESVEEALCFGWIDSIIKRIDEEKYCRKFTPRKDDSCWSDTNRRRVEKVTKEGRMTVFGQAKIEAAKRLGNWEVNPRPAINLDLPQDLSEALTHNGKAKAFFDHLSPTYRKHFIGYLVTAKRPATRKSRLKESLALLERGQKLGLK